MENRLAQMTDCTGCAACNDVCPSHCIEMCRNKEGFLYPQIDEDRCLDCGLCNSVCPICSPPSTQEQKTAPLAFCLLHKNRDIWEASSSGGAFSGICEAYGNEKTVIYGAAFSDERTVRHIRLSGYGNIGPLRKSKYVQSKMMGVYKSIKADLTTGRQVIFSGTPCQVAGVKNYLHVTGERSNDILFVDFVCHGVGSPAVFADFISALERSKNRKIITYTFRDKKKYGLNLETYISTILLNDLTRQVIHMDPYNRAFIQKLVCRSSCFKCRFAKHQRNSDITIADFKHVFMAFPEKSSAYNYSSIILNTQKGEALLSRIAEICFIDACDVKFLYRNNPPLDHCSGNFEKRNQFFREFTTGENANILALLQKYGGHDKPFMVLWKLVPEKLREKIKQVIMGR